MKEKIKARLKAKYSGVNLSETRRNAIAEKLAKKLTDESEESEIDEALDDLNEIYAFADMAKSDDRTRTEEAKKKADEAAAKAKKEEGSEDPKKDDEVPAWAKGLLESNKVLSEKLATLESSKAKDSRKSVFEAKLEKVPASVKSTLMKNFERMNFTDDDDFNAYIGELDTEVSSLSQELSNNGLKGFGKPIIGAGKADKQATDEQAKAVLDKI